MAQDVRKIAAQQIPDASPGQLLRDVIESQGLGPTEAAEKLQTSRTSFSLMLSDKRPISYQMAQRCEEMFGVPAYVLARLRFEADFACMKPKGPIRP